MSLPAFHTVHVGSSLVGVGSHGFITAVHGGPGKKSNLLLPQ